jgi:hypothetical protein
MTRKNTKASRSQSQSDKFKAMAKELECEDSAAPLDKALCKAAKPAPAPRLKKR